MMRTAGTMAVNEPRNCAVCHAEETLHRAAEAAGKLNHRFSHNGELYPVEKIPRQAPPARAIIANAVDMQLRELLISKGILTYEDFGWSPVHSPGSGNAGDQGTGGATPTG